MVIREYQKLAIENVTKKLDKHGKAILIAPCGSGKTVMLCQVAVKAVKKKQQVIIFVQTDELVNQTIEKLIKSGIDRTCIGIEKAEEEVVGEPDVVIASIQTINKNPKSASSRMNKLMKHIPRLGLAVIDECHHARATATEKMLDHLIQMRPQIQIIGCSATPIRSDNLELDQIFGDPDLTWVNIEREQLVQDGFLVPIRHTFLSVVNEQALNRIPTSLGDYKQKALAELVGAKLVTDAIVEAVYERKDVPGVVYACDIKHAELLRAAIAERGVAVGLISSHVNSYERRKIITDFSIGKIKCLVNVMVLTEGFDAPNMQYVLLARPTRSNVLFEQIIGRVARLADGKAVGEVIHLTSIRFEKQRQHDEIMRKRKEQDKKQSLSLRLVKEVIREYYLGEMMRHMGILRPGQIEQLARDFSAISGICGWLPLRTDGPLYTVIPTKRGYDGYKHAIFAVAGPADKVGTIKIFAVNADKIDGMWQLNGPIVWADGSPAQVIHEFLIYVGKNEVANKWLYMTDIVPSTFYPKISIHIPDSVNADWFDASQLEYLVAMSAVAEGYFKSLSTGNLFIKNAWRTATYS